MVPYLIALLPKATYHVYLDNLFTSPQLLEYLQKRGIAATGICRVTSEVVQELVDLKKTREKGPNAMPWGELHAFPTTSNLVNQTRFQDRAFALAMSTYWDRKSTVLRVRKRPKQTAGNTIVSRRPFSNHATKALEIPTLYNAYNEYIGAVNISDQLQGHNDSLRTIKFGLIQVTY